MISYSKLDKSGKILRHFFPTVKSSEFLSQALLNSQNVREELIPNTFDIYLVVKSFLRQKPNQNKAELRGERTSFPGDMI